MDRIALRIAAVPLAFAPAVAFAYPGQDSASLQVASCIHWAA